MRSHTFVIRNTAEKYGLRRQFVEAIALTKDERRKMTVLHALAGKVPGKTGRTLCTICGCRISDTACEKFGRRLTQQIDWILEDYIDSFCPECKEKMTGYEPVRVATGEPVCWKNLCQKSSEETGFDFERKTKIQPCGCVVDEPEMIASVDRSKLNEDAKNGVVVPSFEGKATDGTDSLNNHGDLQSNAGCPGGK